jgi:putative tricarboxylic transport membrane protein
LSAVIAWDAWHLRAAGGYGGVGPASFPYMVAIGLVGLAVATAVAAWRGQFPKRESDAVGPILWIVGGLAAQMLLLKTAGFTIATTFLFAATARGFGQRPAWLALVAGFVLSLVIYVIFARGLGLSLPPGPLERALV